MKNKYHDIIRKRLRLYRKECLDCLYPEKSYQWGNEKLTLVLLNKILKDVPIEAWPKNEEDNYVQYKIASNNWTIKLTYEDGRRTADLKFRNDDHTAWVIEHSRKPGLFVDFDIGGS